MGKSKGKRCKWRYRPYKPPLVITPDKPDKPGRSLLKHRTAKPGRTDKPDDSAAPPQMRGPVDAAATIDAAATCEAQYTERVQELKDAIARHGESLTAMCFAEYGMNMDNESQTRKEWIEAGINVKDKTKLMFQTWNEFVKDYPEAASNQWISDFINSF